MWCIKVLVLCRLLHGPLSFCILNAVLFGCGFTLFFTDIDITKLEMMRPFVAHDTVAQDGYNSLRDETASARTVAVMLGLVAATWLTFMGLLGVGATVLNIKCLLYIYLHAMLLSFMLWMGFASAIFFITSRRALLHSVVTLGFEFNLMFNYDGLRKTDSGFERFVDRMQVELSCCGMNNYTEFRLPINRLSQSNFTLMVPPSCCKLDKGIFRYTGKFELRDNKCTRYPSLENSHIRQSCYKEIEPLIQSQMRPLKLLVAIVSTVIVFLIMMTVYLIYSGGHLLFCL